MQARAANMKCHEPGVKEWDDTAVCEDACGNCSTTSQSAATSSISAQDNEHERVLREQEVSSVPGDRYVQDLYANGKLPATCRGSTVDWIVGTCSHLRLSGDVLFLAVQCFDKYLADVLQGGSAVTSSFLQSQELHLTAIAALWVAAKFEEPLTAPGASAFLRQLPATTSSSSSGSCSIPATHHQLLETEARLLTVIDHRLAKPTSKTFLRRYLQRVAVSRCVYFTAGYLAELSLLDGGMLCFLPSAVAASAYAWALTLTGHACPDSHLTRLTGYSSQDILPCLLRLARVHAAACNTSKPCCISCKYLNSAVEQVAALPPVAQEGVEQLEQQLQRQQEQVAAAASCRRRGQLSDDAPGTPDRGGGGNVGKEKKRAGHMRCGDEQLDA